MDIPDRRQSYRKIAASLSALGVGALLGGRTAEASNIIYSGWIDVPVQIGLPAYSSGPLGASSVQFAFATGGPFSSGFRRGVVATGFAAVRFLTSSHFLRLVDRGALWPASGSHSQYYAFVAGRHWQTIYSSASGFNKVYGSTGTIGPGPFSNKYALFQFSNGPETDYGWIRLSLSITNQAGKDPALGPTLTIHDWAYDASGQPLAAGNAPEPATAVETGLAALALGAVGLRKWRKARNAA
jgi:hypothetical protein